MKHKALNKKILIPLLLLVYLGTGIFSIIYAWGLGNFTNFFVGLIVFLSSLVHILLFFIKEGYKKFDKASFLLIGVLGFIAGFVFMFVNMELSLLCLLLGILDIIRSSFEVLDSIREIKEDKLEIIELIVALGDIALGILICFERENGLVLHLTYLGVAFFISAIKLFIETYILNRNKRKK